MWAPNLWASGGDYDKILTIDYGSIKLSSIAMNRRQMTFIILVNALVSLLIVLLVTWIVELRRPDPEELAALYTPAPAVLLAPTVTVPVETLPVIEGDAQATPDTSTTQAESDETVYVVQAGDSLLGVAARFGVTIDDLVQANNLANPDFVFSGQRLIIPAAGQTAAPNATPQPAAPGEPQIVAVESAGNLADEAVLIVNESDNPASLAGWRLEREGGPTYTFGNVQLFAGSSIRVYSTSGEDNTIALYWGQLDPVWTAGAVVRLLDGDGVEMMRQVIP